jgi:hypothetical protein
MSQVISIDAPVEGWDAFHSMDTMPPTAAVILDNLIPGAGDVTTRAGYVIYEDLGTGAPVDTIADFNPADGSQLIACSAGGVWSLTDSEPTVKATTVTEIEPPGTFQSDAWDTENFSKADESGVLIMCNGIDDAQVYDGTVLTALDTAGSVPAVTPDFIGCLTFKGRMYYWKDDDNAFYYAQAGSYQGALQRFDLGTFVQEGGKIVSVFSWTQQDSGHGRDDFIVFVFNTGEILVYQGDDPETAGYWEQTGRYLTAEPLSIRGQAGYGADAILMTKDGYISMSSIIQEGRTSDVPSFSRLIHDAVIKKTRTNSNLFGWDVQLFQREGLMIFNVPLSEETFEQHVVNTVTQRWCRFRDLNVRTVEVHNERLFGGTIDGKVIAMLETTADNGQPITFNCLYAFGYLSDPGYQKHVTAAQILSTHSNPSEITLSAWADYEIPGLPPLNLPGAIGLGVWSVGDPGLPPDPPSPLGSFWDEDYWSGEGAPYTSRGWQNVSAMGFAIAILVRFAKVNETVVWRSTQVRFNQLGAQ